MKENWGIYIHVPWCRRRCHYCDFYFEVGKAQKGFAEKVVEEWQARTAGLETQIADTLYWGGGTPSSLPLREIEELVKFFKQNGLSPHAEITLEANPEDITLEYAKGLYSIGINRISLGAQSYEDEVLKRLSRKHRAHDILKSLECFRTAGIDNVSVDCIIGVPGEKLEKIQEFIQLCAYQGVKHFSLYLLTVEEKTQLAQLIEAGRYPAMDEDYQADIYEKMQGFLWEKGYRQYEISSYAKPGFESRHNRIYWSKGSYLGLGPGAHSMELQEDGSVKRRGNKSLLKEWWAQPVSAPYEEEHLTQEEAFKEALAFGLRDLQAGVDLTVLARRHQVEVSSEVRSILKKFKKLGWLHDCQEVYLLTVLGARFADKVAREILQS